MGSRITSLRDGYVSLLLRGTREIEGAGKVKLVYVGELWRMGGECLLMPCGDQLGLGSLAKRSWMLWQSRQLPDSKKTSKKMGLDSGQL